MNLRQPVTPLQAIVIILVVIYAIALPALIALTGPEASLVRQVSAAEAAVAQAATSAQNSAPTLRANLAAERDRLAGLESRVPKDVQTSMFDTVAQDAQNGGISDFRYQRKGEFQETLQAGVYKVYRYTISGRGSQDKVIAFLNGLQASTTQTMVIENVGLSAVGKEWHMNADIIVYTWGG